MTRRDFTLPKIERVPVPVHGWRRFNANPNKAKYESPWPKFLSELKPGDSFVITYPERAAVSHWLKKLDIQHEFIYANIEERNRNAGLACLRMWRLEVDKQVHAEWVAARQDRANQRRKFRVADVVRERNLWTAGAQGDGDDGNGS